MTESELKAAYDIVAKFIANERAMRQVVFGRDPDKLRRKLEDCRRAALALAAIKDCAKVHVEESPYQATLLEVPEQRGGY